MKTIKFFVQGSSSEPYEITFGQHGQEVFADCTCKAALMGQVCKHRLQLLEGEVTDLISHNLADLSTVVSWLTGTELERALSSLRGAENDYEAAKKCVANAKKALSFAMSPPPDFHHPIILGKP